MYSKNEVCGFLHNVQKEFKDLENEDIGRIDLRTATDSVSLNRDATLDSIPVAGTHGATPLHA